MKYRFSILAFIFAICTLTANADTYTDGIAKRVADGQSKMELSDSPVLDFLFDRTLEQRKQGVLEFIASIFRKHMTEKEFKAWMTYKPSAEEAAYEERLTPIKDSIQSGLAEVISSDSIKALLLAGREVQTIQAKPCSESYMKAFKRFADVNNIYIICSIKKALAGFVNSIDSAQVDPITLKSWDIWENNMRNSILNGSIDHCTEQQLKEFTRELPFQKQIDEIVGDYMGNIFGLFEAAYGVNVNDIEGVVDKKSDEVVEKFGHQTVDFNVSFTGILRVYPQGN